MLLTLSSRRASGAGAIPCPTASSPAWRSS